MSGDCRPGFFPHSKTLKGTRDKIDSLVTECRTYAITEEIAEWTKNCIATLRFAAAVSVLRILAEHTMYDPNNPAYRWVLDDYCKADRLAELAAISLSTAKRALAALKKADLIEVTYREDIQGRPCRINITPLFDGIRADEEHEQSLVAQHP